VWGVVGGGPRGGGGGGGGRRGGGGGGGKMFRTRPDGPCVPLTLVQWAPGYSQRQSGRLVALTRTNIKERV